MEFSDALLVVSDSIEPVVSALAERGSNDCVVAVDQFQVCVKFRLSMVFVATAAVMPDNGGAAPALIMFCHDPFW